MSQTNNNQNGTYGQGLVKGLAPVIDTPEIGRVFQDTTKAFAAKVVEVIRNSFNITELDNIIIAPTMARNAVGITDLTAVAYFVTKNGKNIFYRGKGNNGNGNGRINMVQAAGSGYNSTGNYGTSNEFDQAIKSLCKINEKGKAIMNIKKVPNARDVASLELDWTSVMALALGIQDDDPYDFRILTVQPIGDSNFSMMIMKHIVSDSSQKGKVSGINYGRITKDLMESVNRGSGNHNNGGNNGNGRSY